MVTLLQELLNINKSKICLCIALVSAPFLAGQNLDKTIFENPPSCRPPVNRPQSSDTNSQSQSHSQSYHNQSSVSSSSGSYSQGSMSNNLGPHGSTTTTTSSTADSQANTHTNSEDKGTVTMSHNAILIYLFIVLPNVQCYATQKPGQFGKY